MNTNDSKDNLLFEVVKEYDATIRTIFRTCKIDKGKAKHELNTTYIVPWIFLLVPLFLSWLICFGPDIFQNDFISYPIFILALILFFLLLTYDERFPNKKIKQKTGVDYKKASYYDLFTLNVENISSEKLAFVAKYIKYLTSDKSKIENYINIFSIFIAFYVSISVVSIGSIHEQDFIPNLVKFLSLSILITIFFNLLIIIVFNKKVKLLRVKKFIEYVLLSRGAEKIKNSFTSPD